MNSDEYCSSLPFFGLSDRVFHATIGSIQTEFDLPEEDFNEVLANPDKNDECDPDLMLNKNFSNYYSLSKLSRLMKATDVNEALSIFHFNTRSLPKNLDTAYLKVLILLCV